MTREEIIIVGEFEILVIHFLGWSFQRPQIGDTSRAFTETIRGWIPPKRAPKMIPLARRIRNIRGLGTVQATFLKT